MADVKLIDQLEVALLKKLEEHARAMFGYSGWDDCDKDARQCVLKVQASLADLTAWRKIVASVSAPEQS